MVTARKYASVKGVEIFGVGSWTDFNGETISWSEHDLDKMVANSVDAPLKLGHTDDAEAIADKLNIPKRIVTGDPSGAGAMRLGRVTNLRRVGKKLLADLLGVPSAITKLIQEGLFNNVSSEIEIASDGSPTISGVALLGSENPAVDSLKGLSAAQIALSAPMSRPHLQFSAPQVTRTKEVPSMPKKEAHIQAISDSLSAGLRIELARRKLKANKPDGQTADMFQDEVNRIAADKYAGDPIAFQKATVYCAREYPIGFRAARQKWDKSQSQKANKKQALVDVDEYTVAVREIMYTAESAGVSFDDALAIVRTRHPRAASVYEVGRQETVDLKYRTYLGGN